MNKARIAIGAAVLAAVIAVPGIAMASGAIQTPTLQGGVSASDAQSASGEGYRSSSMPSANVATGNELVAQGGSGGQGCASCGGTFDNGGTCGGACDNCGSSYGDGARDGNGRCDGRGSGYGYGTSGCDGSGCGDADCVGDGSCGSSSYGNCEGYGFGPGRDGTSGCANVGNGTSDCDGNGYGDCAADDTCNNTGADSGACYKNASASHVASAYHGSSDHGGNHGGHDD